MTTAGDIIKGSLRLIGQLAEGEEPSADTAQDALAAMNQMIDSWSTERLAVFTTQTQIFTWPAGQASQTIGPSGNFVGQRPIKVDDATYYVDPRNNLSFNVQLINQQQYNGISSKGESSDYPQVLWVEPTYPDAKLTVFPVPSADLQWYIVSMQPLAKPALLATELAFPPGYLRAFRYNLACELAAEFGVEPSMQVMRIAMTSKRNLKRINNPDDVMALPYELFVSPNRYSIYADV